MNHIVPRYFLQGVAGVDVDTPEAPLQGITLLRTVFDTQVNKFIRVQRDAQGEPALGYLAREVSAEEAAVWAARMQGAAQHPDDGFEDAEGRWYPGDIGAGISVINAEGYALRVTQREAHIQALRAQAQQVQTVTPQQAREALIHLGLDDDVEAAIAAIPDAIKRKVVRNWYEYTTEWVYGHPVLAQFTAALGVNKDELFALAKTL